MSLRTTKDRTQLLRRMHVVGIVDSETCTGVEASGEMPIDLVAVNAKMLRLAGEIADGVLVTRVP